MTHDAAFWLRAFNRLEIAITRHFDAKTWTDDADDALHHAWRQVLKAVGPRKHGVSFTVSPSQRRLIGTDSSDATLDLPPFD